MNLFSIFRILAPFSTIYIYMCVCEIQFMYNFFMPHPASPLKKFCLAPKTTVSMQHISFVCDVMLGHASSKVRKLNSVTHSYSSSLPFLPHFFTSASAFFQIPAKKRRNSFPHVMGFSYCINHICFVIGSPVTNFSERIITLSSYIL